MSRTSTGFLLLALLATARAADPATTLCFDQPAANFHQALPLGNGRIGAMIFGGVDEERIVLNESSVWSGSREEADRPAAHEALPEIRRLLLAGKNIEAEALVNKNFTCQGQGSGHGRGAHVPFGCYQTLGDLRLKFGKAPSHAPGVSDYTRTLDLSSGLGTVAYTRNGTRFERTHYISAPDQVFVTHLKANQPGALSFTVTIERKERFETSAPNNHDLLMTGTLDDGHGGQGVSYATRLRVVTQGGVIKREQDKLIIEQADAVYLFVTAATDFHGFAGRQVVDPVAATQQDLEAAMCKTPDALRAAQQADHRQYFDRVNLQLPSTANSGRPTPARLIGFAQGAPDPALAALYFNYGRYLLISSSRPGGLPANLQGLWAEEIQTPWNGDWHLDINVQMNYWPAQVCNLSELQEPLNKLIASLVAPGRKTAHAYYNARGWVAHVITNPWGFTAPGEAASWGATTSGSAWLCAHLWEQYAFTLDREFLAWAYPILKESALFYLDNLIEEPQHKWLVTGPSNSPENAFRLPSGKVAHICLGPTIDMQLLRELFGNTARAAEMLGVDAALCHELLAKRARLAPNQVGPDGRLQEWLEPYPEPEPTHRHTSPMYGLFPASEITRRGTPGLAAACRKFLDMRGDRSNGWALAWRISLWARLGDGDRAYQLLQALLHLTGEKGLNYTGQGSGSYANLFDACPPFQIDGNFGGCAGIAEMLLQSHESSAGGMSSDVGRVEATPPSTLAPRPASPDTRPSSPDTALLELLPALPAAWPTGSVKGLRARGGYTVDMAWQEGRVISYRIAAAAPREVQVRMNDCVKTIRAEKIK